MKSNRRNLFFATLSVLALVVSGPLRAAPPAGATYADGATSQWFKSLASAYTHNCCDQADCRRAMSDYRDGAWWARSNRTGKWVEIAPAQITSTVSIFNDAVLCEGDPSYAGDARVFCFAPPPIAY